jgi:hypothetical protein
VFGTLTAHKLVGTKGTRASKLAIEDGDVLDVLRHPKEGRYPDQLILVVAVEGYAYLVPYVEEPDGYFLETVIPSRKATREYLSQGER